jgi:hypothetical protein
MNAPKPSPDDDPSLREALLRDAARIVAPPFDTALHHAAMRRIRALPAAREPRQVWRWALVPATALLLLGGIALWRNFEPVLLSPAAADATQSVIVESLDTAGLAWTYQRAAMEGDDALQAMLDRDARAFLTASTRAFSTPLP